MTGPDRDYSRAVILSGGPTAFLTARLAEDEAKAKVSAAGTGPWALPHRHRDADVAHIARHDPARVLRQVEAGRAILAAHANALKTWRAAKAAQDNDRRVAAAHVLLVWEHVLKIHAAVYRDHPDYDPAWG